ncbi:phospholipase B-like 1 [Phalacrocorax aristotelis]|uniref:phospholipase B-like 1 n=1 Tax=Phalacrocorax aristotelis TaxID=126867 RepID=UPI003F4BA2CA
MARLGGGVCCCWGLVLLWAAAGGRAEIQYATVYWNRAEKTLQVRNILDRSGDAYGFYNNTVQTTGWGVLEIRAGYGRQTLSNEDIMYAAGFLEGYLTAPHMYDHAANMYPQLIKNPTIRSGVQNFMAKQDQWTRQQIRNNKDDPFWRHAGYIIAQLDGLYMGALEWAKLHKQTPLSIFDVQFLNAVGDLLDLIPALFEYSARGGQCNVEPGSHGKYQWDMGHCSALIKVLPGYENIYFAHSSWFTYAATLRIYKHWNFNIVDPDTSTGRVSFSSYPGFLVSLDDFYILGSGLVMLQTTNSVFNQTLIKQVVPESLLAWQRVRIANMMADGGKTWAETFSKCNSGTYNNQYMVLDLKKVKLQKSLDDGALYIVEQIPTLVEYSDQTNILRKGYWPSYNIPFHEKIYNLSGYAAYVEKYGMDFSYELAPRAKIFRRDQGKVTNLESMKYIMRYNNYQRDPYAERNPCNTICCREDLNPSFPVPAGCYDSKVSDFRLASAFTATAINGPPVQGGLPVFTWRQFNHTRHQGLPESYNFHFVTMRPIL